MAEDDMPAGLVAEYVAADEIAAAIWEAIAGSRLGPTFHALGLVICRLVADAQQQVMTETLSEIMQFVGEAALMKYNESSVRMRGTGN